MLTPIGTNLFGMQTKHGIAVVRICLADVKDGLTRMQIDGRDKDLRAACLTGPLYNGITVGSKFLAVQMAMSVYVIGC